VSLGDIIDTLQICSVESARLAAFSASQVENSALLVWSTFGDIFLKWNTYLT